MAWSVCSILLGESLVPSAATVESFVTGGERMRNHTGCTVGVPIGLVAMLVASLGASVRAESLLAQYTYISGQHSSWFGPGEFTKVKFTPRHYSGSDDPVVVGESESPWWHHGDAGMFDFTASTTNFSAFADLITDGQNDNLYFLASVKSEDEVYSAQTGVYKSESAVFVPSPSDLIGYDVTRIRMNVANVKFYKDLDGWKHCEAYVQWQFYGDVIPEPTMLAAFAVGGLMVVRRRRG